MSDFEKLYPHISSWVQDGCLEIGDVGYGDDSFIRVLDEGGTVWDSSTRFENLDEALTAADAAIAEWYKGSAPELVGLKDASPSFTPKQGQYLAYIFNYTQIHGRSPAQADLETFFRVTPPTVQQMLLKLEKSGLISRLAGEARSISVLVLPEKLPVLTRP